MSVCTAGCCGYSQWFCQGYTRHKMTLESLFVPATIALCNMTTCVQQWSLEERACDPHNIMAGLSNKSSLDLAFLRCNVNML